MTTSDPTRVAVRRSNLRVVALEAGLELDVVDGVELARGAPAAAAGATIADLSTCDRLGMKGRGSAAWLASQGVPLPERPNRLVVRDDGLLVARYAENEFVLATFGALRSAAIDAIREALRPGRPAGCYPVPRADSQAAFGLCGDGTLEALASLCAADLRPAAFGPGDVLQTMCAGIGAQLLNRSTAGATRVVVLCDASFARHAWDALLDASAAEGGRIASQADWFAADAAR